MKYSIGNQFTDNYGTRYTVYRVFDDNWTYRVSIVIPTKEISNKIATCSFGYFTDEYLNSLIRL